jgi:N-acetylglutamate synthase-like GNAT family acetyltransferase
VSISLADTDDEYEINEVSWWSNWTQEAIWLDKNAYLLFSRDFPEYFFNHGGFLKVTNKAASEIDLMEVEFKNRDLSPYVFIQSNSLRPNFLLELAAGEYRITDQMSVMEVESPSFKTNPNLTIEMGIDDKLESWADVYLSAFYGSNELIDPVLAILKRISKNKEVSLVLASKDRKPAGCLALFRSQTMLGVYCVGAVPSMRDAHVASTILDFSNKLAKSEGRRLILQTMLSDSVELLYVKLGFRRVYLKELFARRSRQTL